MKDSIKLFIDKVEEISQMIEVNQRENSRDRMRKLKKDFKRSTIQEKREGKKWSNYWQNNLRKCPN